MRPKAAKTLCVFNIFMIEEKTTDSYLAEMVKKHANQDALSMLIDRHSGICYKIYNIYNE